MQAKVRETQKEIADVEKQLTILTADHTRVRENLKIVPPSSEHYKTFLEKFVAQDKQIETFLARRGEAHGVALDHTRFFHLLDAAPAGRRTQAHGVADVLQAGARVGLQNLKDFSVQCVHEDNLSDLWRFAEFISVFPK